MNLVEKLSTFKYFINNKDSSDSDIIVSSHKNLSFDLTIKSHSGEFEYGEYFELKKLGYNKRKYYSIEFSTDSSKDEDLYFIKYMENILLKRYPHDFTKYFIFRKEDINLMTEAIFTSKDYKTIFTKMKLFEEKIKTGIQPAIYQDSGYSLTKISEKDSKVEDIIDENIVVFKVRCAYLKSKVDWLRFWKRMSTLKRLKVIEMEYIYEAWDDMINFYSELFPPNLEKLLMKYVGDIQFNFLGRYFKFNSLLKELVLQGGAGGYPKINKFYIDDGGDEITEFGMGDFRYIRLPETLTDLEMSSFKIYDIPKCPNNLKNLSLSACALGKNISWKNLNDGLEVLSLCNNNIKKLGKIPDSIKELELYSVHHCFMDDCHSEKQIPYFRFTNVPKNLESLDLSCTKIDNLPSDLIKCNNLKRLIVDDSRSWNRIELEELDDDMILFLKHKKLLKSLMIADE